MKKPVYIEIVIAVIVLGVFLIYERYTIISCTNKATEAVREMKNAEALDYQRVYDLIYKSCMGKKGFER